MSLYYCLDCNSFFEEPKRYIEKHNLDTPPYEEYDGCPYCAGDYITPKRCYYCGEYLTGDYFLVPDGRLICPECCHPRNVDEWRC